MLNNFVFGRAKSVIFSDLYDHREANTSTGENPEDKSGRSPHVYINQRLQINFRASDDERYGARKMLSLQLILE
jgi:hypothetical protein